MPISLNGPGTGPHGRPVHPPRGASPRRGARHRAPARRRAAWCRRRGCAAGPSPPPRRCSCAPPWLRGTRLRLAGAPLDRVEPAHLGAQLGAHPLDLVVLVGLAEARELRAAGLVLGDPAPCERAVLDLVQDLAHGVPDVLLDDARAADVVAVFGAVADAAAPEVQA